MCRKILKSPIISFPKMNAVILDLSLVFVFLCKNLTVVPRNLLSTLYAVSKLVDQLLWFKELLPLQ